MKQDLRVAVTKRMIREALLRLLESKPIDKIRVNELCAASAVNRATFYRHYETLRDVLQEIEGEFIRGMPRAVESPRNMEEAQAQLEILCSYLYDHVDLLKILIQNQSEREMMEHMSSFYQEFLCTTELGRTIAEYDTDTVRIVGALWIGGFQCMIRKWIMGEIRKTPKELARILCDLHKVSVSLGFD